MAELRESLRNLQHQAVYTITRYQRRSDLDSFLIPYRSRLQSIESCLDLESELAQAEVMYEAQAKGEPSSAQTAGVLNAERTRLEARYRAERRALEATNRIFQIRLRALRESRTRSNKSASALSSR